MSFCRCSSRVCYHSSWRGKDQDHARKGIHTLNTATQHNASSGSEFINTAVRWCLAGGELSDPRSGREHVLTVSACRTGAGRGSAGTLVTPVCTYITSPGIWTISGTRCLCEWLVLRVRTCYYFRRISIPRLLVTERWSRGPLSLRLTLLLCPSSKASPPKSSCSANPPLPPSPSHLFSLLARSNCMSGFPHFVLCVCVYKG